MRFLLDNNLSPKLAQLLRGAGNDVVHVRGLGLGSAFDQAAIILSNLDPVRADLDARAIVVLGEATLRIRRLPIAAPGQSG